MKSLVLSLSALLICFSNVCFANADSGGGEEWHSAYPEILGSNEEQIRVNDQKLSELIKKISMYSPAVAKRIPEVLPQLRYRMVACSNEALLVVYDRTWTSICQSISFKDRESSDRVYLLLKMALTGIVKSNESRSLDQELSLAISNVVSSLRVLSKITIRGMESMKIIEDNLLPKSQQGFQKQEAGGRS